MSVFLRKYGVAITGGTAQAIWIPVIKRGVVDFALSADWTPSAGQVQISKDGGVAANIATLPVAKTMANGGVWEFVFSAAELTASRIVVTVSCAATKPVEDQCFIIETFGNASAMWPADLTNGANLALTGLPSANPGANGGMPTVDANNNIHGVQPGTGTGQLNPTGGKVPATVAAGDGSDAATLVARLTAARAGYLDNLNIAGAVASHADIAALNQSASKHIILTSVPQYEPGETYTVEARTFAAADGSAVNADSNPTLTATGQVSGSLTGNLSAITNPATGVYRWTYMPGATPTLEQIRFDISATINSATFTLSCYAQTIDAATAVFTATDQTHLTTIFNKLPANNIADQTLLPAAVAAATWQDLLNSGDFGTANSIGKLLATFTFTGSNVNAQSSGNVTVGGYAANQDPATLVLGSTASSWNTAGTIGHDINASGNAGDPWSVILATGGYTTGMAGQILLAIASTPITYVGPVDPVTGNASIVQGDDYKAADSRALQWTNAAGTWPNLTGAQISFVAKPAGGPLVGPFAMTAPVPNGANQQVRLELTAAQTEAYHLPSGTYPFVVVAILTDTNTATIVRGLLTVSTRP